jgi:predicted ATPase/DNA-binding SARP family transcriptional activator
MEYRLLGPLEVLDGNGHRLPLGGVRQQSVLASLLLRAERTVSLEQLVEQLWEEPPASALRTVRVYVSRLRQELPAGAIERRAGGYAVRLDGDRLDLRVFEQAAEEGRAALAANDCERAVQLLREALALWRGPALAGLTSEALRREAARLEELRLQVLEDRFEAELVCGHHRELVPELQAFVTEEPFRERPSAQLMQALYRAGRPGDALEFYREKRRLLVEELGMEPGQEMRALEQAILRADPALDLPRSKAQTNLPLQPTPLVGRERELREVLELLRANRLLTLTGSGGVGKTRLALRAAAELMEDFRDGVWFVSLAALRDPELVLPTVAQTLGVNEPQMLEQHLHERQLLLVLDNFEQLLDSVPSLAELLREARNSKLLVTSRTSLRLAGEQEYPVPPLTTEAAVELFIERGRAAQPSFTPDEHVAEICRRLDNLPLALELAAVRVKVHSPEALLARLERRLPLLTGGPRDLPERQRTLRATLDWSYGLLTVEEQELFARLAVFAGGSTMEAAEEVADADVDALQALVDKSLLGQRDDRFWMLETIREFALERLEESGQAEQLYRRHAESFLNLAERTDSGLRGPDSRLRLDRIAADHDNFRAALGWMLTQGDLELEVRLAASLQPYFEARGHVSEGRRWLEAGLGRADELPFGVRAKAVYCLGRLVELSGDDRQAAALYVEASELFRVANDRAGVMKALTELADSERREGNLGRAETLTNESVELARTIDDSVARSDALHSAAWMALKREDRSRARALFQESLGLRRDAGDAIGTSVSLVTLGWLDLEDGELGVAENQFAEALALARAVNDIESIVHALDNLGLVALRLSDYNRAEDLFAEGLELASAMGDRGLVAECLAGMAAAGGSGNPDRLARLLGASEGIHEALDTPFTEDEIWILERFVEGARTDLGQDLFSTEWAKGKAMSPEEAVAYARGQVGHPQRGSAGTPARAPK